MTRTDFLLLFLIFALSATLPPGCAKRQIAGTALDRSEQIANMIEKAERLGARDCSPRELARVKVKLEHALHERDEGHYPLSWTERKFDEAERSARELLEKRVMAKNSGLPFRCFHREGNRGEGTRLGDGG